MAVTAKELAKILGISQAAVSIALNNRPGVSEDTRKRVVAAAREYGYTSANTHAKESKPKVISFVLYKKQEGIIIDNTPFFSALTEGVAVCCRENGFSLDMRYIYESANVASDIEDIVASGVSGIILLATEMRAEDFDAFKKISIPMVVLDTYFENISTDCVLINNIQGAYLAAETLIRKRGNQPGYLRSSYMIGNFEERADGFYKAIRSNNMSTSKSVVHLLKPTVNGAHDDMCAILDSGAETADCYFADNDMIAVGAMLAFKEHGYEIPRDVAIIGFDNAYPENLIKPALTTIDVPKQAMARLAVERLIKVMSEVQNVSLKIQVMTSLIERDSL